MFRCGEGLGALSGKRILVYGSWLSECSRASRMTSSTGLIRLLV